MAQKIGSLPGRGIISVDKEVRHSGREEKEEMKAAGHSQTINQGPGRGGASSNHL